MNFKNLFETQKKFDELVKNKFKVTDQEIWLYQIQAFLTELGETSNEWKGFKYWSNDQSPRNYPLLEEYADGLHVLISIGLMMGYNHETITGKIPYPISKKKYSKDKINLHFLNIYNYALKLRFDDYYIILFRLYVELSSMLGFTWGQVEQAFYTKNTINHKRQKENY